MINCILLGLLLRVSMVHAKYENSPLVIHFLNFVRVFHLQVLLIAIFPVFFVVLFHLQSLMITLAKILFFVSQIKNASFSKKFLISYDVTSLFTNIPLQETIGIAINLFFNHNPHLNITRKELKKLFLFATSQTLFIFNSEFFNQIDGLAMGSHLVPVLANLFMGFHKPKRLDEYNPNKSKFYLRYIDDILAAFYNEQHSPSFLNFLNSRHANIKFTIEKRINISFPSLFLMHSFQVSIFKTSHFKHITN